MFGHCLFRIVKSLRTALDSLTMTDDPNSRKFILVIADGMVGALKIH